MGLKVVETKQYLLIFCGGPANKRPKINDGSNPPKLRESAATPPQQKSEWDWNLWRGTMWLTNVADVNVGKLNAGKPLFQIVDDDTVPDELEKDQEDILKPFAVENGRGGWRTCCMTHIMIKVSPRRLYCGFASMSTTTSGM
jgi:hypothetical protein